MATNFISFALENSHLHLIVGIAYDVVLLMDYNRGIVGREFTFTLTSPLFPSYNLSIV